MPCEMPATLASLPPEIHAKIAAMCALQDQRYLDAEYASRLSTLPLQRPARKPATVSALSVLSSIGAK